MREKKDLENVGGEPSDDTAHFQFLEQQMFRKTYVAAKKEIDEWLRAYSYVRSSRQGKDESFN